MSSEQLLSTTLLPSSRMDRGRGAAAAAQKAEPYAASESRPNFSDSMKQATIERKKPDEEQRLGSTESSRRSRPEEAESTPGHKTNADNDSDVERGLGTGDLSAENSMEEASASPLAPAEQGADQIDTELRLVTQAGGAAQSELAGESHSLHVRPLSVRREQLTHALQLEKDDLNENPLSTGMTTSAKPSEGVLSGLVFQDNAAKLQPNLPSQRQGARVLPGVAGEELASSDLTGEFKVGDTALSATKGKSMLASQVGLGGAIDKSLSGSVKVDQIFSSEPVLLSTKTQAPPSTVSEALSQSQSAAGSVVANPSNPLVLAESGRLTMPATVSFGQAGWSGIVADKAAWAVSQNIKSAEIQLDPPELGPLQVKIHVSNDQASVNFISAHAQVRDALDSTMAKLKEMLSEQGMELVDSGVSDQGSGEESETSSSPQLNGESATDAENSAAEVNQSVTTLDASLGVDDFV